MTTSKKCQHGVAQTEYGGCVKCICERIASEETVKKPVHKTAFASFVRSLIHAIAPSMPICVCMSCVLPTDEVIATAGDYSLCDRCRASITSKTGLAVRLRQPREAK